MLASTASTVILLLLGLPVVVLCAALLLRGCLVRIDAGDLGLVVVRGKPTGRTLLPGTHVILPFGRMTIHSYPSRELSYRTTRDAGAEDDARPSSDPPVGVVLGDRTHAEVCYSIRFRIDPDRVPDIHLSIGPEGIFGLVRDLSERVVADGVAADDVVYEDLFGSQRSRLQSRLGELLTTELASRGLIVTFFALREVDLGELGDAVQARAREQAFAERELVVAEARRVRAVHDMELATILEGMPDNVLRYHQIEAWRALVERWDGRIGIPAGPPAPGSPAAPAEDDLP